MAKKKKSKKHVRTKTSKKTVSKSRKRTRKSISKKSAKRQTKNVVTKDTKVVRKNTGRKSPTKSSKKSKSVKSKKYAEIDIRKIRGENTVEFFSHADTLEELIEAWKASDSINKAIDYYIRKNRPVKGAGYKAPRAVVVIITSPVGNKTKAVVSPLEFVVSRINVKAFVVGILEQMVSDFELWIELMGAIDEEGLDGSSENFDPNSITTITLKFIY